jgi:hypothetical protein
MEDSYLTIINCNKTQNYKSFLIFKDSPTTIANDEIASYINVNKEDIYENKKVTKYIIYFYKANDRIKKYPMMNMFFTTKSDAEKYVKMHKETYGKLGTDFFIHIVPTDSHKKQTQERIRVRA